MAVEIDPKRTAILVYDMNSPIVEKGSQSYNQWAMDGMPTHARLLAACRKAGIPVYYAISARGYAGFEICAPIAPANGETVLRHDGSGAFFNTELEALLKNDGRDTLLITGMAVDRGANTAARYAQNLDIRPVMVAGACYAYDLVESPFGPVSARDLERVHLAALHRMGIISAPIEELTSALG